MATEIQAPAGYNKLTNPITVTISSNIDSAKDGTVTFAWAATNATDEGDGTFTFDVENQSGNELPETGGIGTTIFYIGGSILVLLAVVLLVTRRRMTGNN